MKKYQYKVKGVDYDVEINEIDGNTAKVTVNGTPFEVEMKQPIVDSADHHHRPVHIERPQPAPVAEKTQAPRPATAQATGSGTPMKSPLPGTILSVEVKVGDTVKEGDTLLVLEAMKMQNNIEAEQGGTVKEILVKQGDTVLEGATLLIIA